VRRLGEKTHSASAFALAGLGCVMSGSNWLQRSKSAASTTSSVRSAPQSVSLSEGLTVERNPSQLNSRAEDEGGNRNIPVNFCSRLSV
jgi:hypothetical protein